MFAKLISIAIEIYENQLINYFQNCSKIAVAFPFQLN